MWNKAEWLKTFEIILNADMALPLPYQKKESKFFIFTTSRFLWYWISESSSINETTAALSATAILFSFLNFARDSTDALYNFAPAVMVTDLMN